MASLIMSINTNLVQVITIIHPGEKFAVVRVTAPNVNKLPSRFYIIRALKLDGQPFINDLVRQRINKIHVRFFDVGESGCCRSLAGFDQHDFVRRVRAGAVPQAGRYKG